MTFIIRQKAKLCYENKVSHGELTAIKLKKFPYFGSFKYRIALVSLISRYQKNPDSVAANCSYVCAGSSTFLNLRVSGKACDLLKNQKVTLSREKFHMKRINVISGQNLAIAPRNYFDVSAGIVYFGECNQTKGTAVSVWSYELERTRWRLPDKRRSPCAFCENTPKRKRLFWVPGQDEESKCFIGKKKNAHNRRGAKNFTEL